MPPQNLKRVVTVAGAGERAGTVLSLVMMLVLADSVSTHRAKPSSPVWHNPCGFRLKSLARKRHFLLDNEISPDGLRHPSSRPLRRVRTQLRITYDHFRSSQLQRDVTIVYSGVKSLLEEEFTYDWLPNHQLAWYRKHVKCLDKKSKVEVLLPTLHASLQNFSATFENLQKHGGESYLSEHQELLYTRRHLLANISHSVNRLLCEVETAILNVGLGLPGTLSIEAANSMLWESRPDHTGGLMQDWVVLAAYQAFLDDWVHIVRRLVGSKSHVPCKTRHKRPRPHR